jgi:hypothetical protein
MKPKHVYEFGVRFPLRSLMSTVSDFEDSINQTMQEFGFSEKMLLTSTVPLEMAVNRELAAAELNQIKALIEQQFCAEFEGAKIEYVKKLS